jgi:hypothetical protein
VARRPRNADEADVVDHAARLAEEVQVAGALLLGRDRLHGRRQVGRVAGQRHPEPPPHQVDQPGRVHAVGRGTAPDVRYVTQAVGPLERLAVIAAGGDRGTAATSSSIAHAGSNRPGTATGNQPSNGAPSAINRVPNVTPGTARAASGSSRRRGRGRHDHVPHAGTVLDRLAAVPVPGATRTPAAWNPSTGEIWSTGSHPG